MFGVYFYATFGLATALCVILGGNNFSTCLGASLGARIVKPLRAVIIASAGVILGTLLEGHKLSGALAGGVLPALPSSDLAPLLVGSLAVMAIVTIFRLPLSLSQVIVGGAWGIGLSTGVQVSSSYSLEVIAAWILSPVLAFLASAVIESLVLRLGQRTKDVITLSSAYGSLTLIAGFYAAYALGANTIGLVTGLFELESADALLLSLTFSAATVFGMFFVSSGTVRSVAENLVGLSPSMALSAQFGGALVVHLFTQLSLPVSIAQVVVGGMEGAASVKRIAITNRRLLLQILAGWTIGPMAGTAITFLLMKAI